MRLRIPKVVWGILTVLLLTAKTYATADSYAVRVVPVQVDGEILDATAYLHEGVTYVPLRSLLDAFGQNAGNVNSLTQDLNGNISPEIAAQVFANHNEHDTHQDHWDIFWDSALQCARAVSDEISLTASPQNQTIVITCHNRDSNNDSDISARVDELDELPNPLVLSAPVSVHEGRTYIPLRILTEALGGKVIWDAYLSGAAVTSPGADFAAEDIYWLSHIISAESQGEILEGQIAVGNVVLNRVKHPDFPNTIQEVIFDRVDGTQFEPVDNQTIYLTPAPLSVLAARLVLSGVQTITQELYFYAPALSSGSWINAHCIYSTTIGCHKFYRA